MWKIADDRQRMRLPIVSPIVWKSPITASQPPRLIVTHLATRRDRSNYALSCRSGHQEPPGSSTTLVHINDRDRLR